MPEPCRDARVFDLFSGGVVSCLSASFRAFFLTLRPIHMHHNLHICNQIVTFDSVSEY